jgi:uncharacterized membrane protein
MKLISAYITSAIVFLVLDLIWLGTIASSFYREQMGDLMAPQFNILAAVLFYALFLVGVMIFAVQPALTDGGVPRALMLGAMFGFFCYMTYDFTAAAVIRGYPMKLALVDTAWGTFLTACAAAAGTAVAQRFS